MKNKFLLNLLLISNVFCFENVESKIENFFSLVQNKTINLIIKNNETKINSNLSIDGDIIFFDSSNHDNTITKIQSNTIFTYDFQNERLIIENADENFLSFFNFKKFNDYKVINKSIFEDNHRITYSNDIYTLEIDFNEELNRIMKIKVIQNENIYFEVEILRIIENNNTIEKLLITKDWKTVDWRVD